MTSDPVLVLETWFVPESIGARYEIEVAPQPWLPRRKLITRDPDLYRDCLDLEGSKVRVLVTTHRSGRDEILDAIDLAPVTGAEARP